MERRLNGAWKVALPSPTILSSTTPPAELPTQPICRVGGPHPKKTCFPSGPSSSVMKRFHILGGGPKQMRQGKRGVLPWRVDQTLRAVKLAGTNKYVYTMLWENYYHPLPCQVEGRTTFWRRYFEWKSLYYFSQIKGSYVWAVKIGHEGSGVIVKYANKWKNSLCVFPRDDDESLFF